MTDAERIVQVTWAGGLAFRGGRPGGPEVLVDGDGLAAPSPMEQLLVAAAGCSAIDVVLILEKMRQPLAALRVEARGRRRDEAPRRYTRLTLAFHARGAGLDPERVARAVALSLEKYCSVLATLAPDVALGHEVHVEG